MCCNLKGHSPLVLQCQVTSDKSGFSLLWHYSSSLPSAVNITTHYLIDQTRPIYNVTQTLELPTVSELQVITSQLSIMGFDDKEAGYYWCSVRRDPLEGTSDASNPSGVLSIRSRYTIEEVQSCQEPVQLHSSTDRCADLAARIDVIEAQNNSASNGNNNSPGTDTEITQCVEHKPTKIEQLLTKAAVTTSAILTQTDEENKATSTMRGMEKHRLI